jgi:predicted SPOUT superfamily RNA methylase MTH1
MRLLKIISAVPLLATSYHTIAQERAVSALRHALVYKTTKDYSKNVSIQLTDDKKSVASYPAPMDVRPELMPVKLKKAIC